MAYKFEKDEIEQWLDVADSMVYEIEDLDRSDEKLKELCKDLQKAIHALEGYLETFDVN